MDLSGFVKDVIDKIQTQVNAGNYGPFRVYIPARLAPVFGDIYEPRNCTLIERIFEIEGVEQIMFCKCKKEIGVAARVPV